MKNNVRLAGAALGEWDDVPGIDLLANAFETCLSVPDDVEPHHLVVIRLSDGAVVRTARPLSAGDGHRGPVAEQAARARRGR